jgi:hypothetical protein
MEWHPCLPFSFLSGPGEPVRRSCEWLSRSITHRSRRVSEGRAKSSRDFALKTLQRLAHNPLSYTNLDERFIFSHNKIINAVTSKTYLTTHYALRNAHHSP